MPLQFCFFLLSNQQPKTCKVMVKGKTLYGGEILTPIIFPHIPRASCMAMTLKAVMEVSESMPRTSPYTSRIMLLLTSNDCQFVILLI